MFQPTRLYRSGGWEEKIEKDNKLSGGETQVDHKILLRNCWAVPPCHTSVGGKESVVRTVWARSDVSSIICVDGQRRSRGKSTNW